VGQILSGSAAVALVVLAAAAFIVFLAGLRVVLASAEGEPPYRAHDRIDPIFGRGGHPWRNRKWEGPRGRNT